MKKKAKLISILVSFILIIVLTMFNNNKLANKTNIDKILETNNYSYLPVEAKEYLKGVYEKTGKIILTEKNKKENEIYLNPQYVEYLTFTEEEKESLGEIPFSMVVDYKKNESSSTIEVPNKYDLRDVDGKKYITKVKDQGDLGLCWTFATTGIAESYLLQNNSNITSQNPLLFSERQIDYITSKNGIKDYKSEYVSFLSRFLGDGGNFYISTIAMANGVSLYNENLFKDYDDKDFETMELSEVINYKKSQYEVDSTINVPRMSLRESTSILTEEEIATRNSYLNEVKKNIMTKGGAYVGTYMNSQCQYTDSNLNNLVIDVYNCSPSSGHAMQIIGWDDDLEYSYCADTSSHKEVTSSCKNIVSGKGVWILKNSWDDELQFPYLTYDSLYSSIHFINEMDSTSNKVWDNNYILGDESEISNEKTYYLKDVKIKDDEALKKIKFITETPNMVYNVEIYAKNGIYKKYSKTVDMPGLVTFEITDNIVVNKDTKIIISTEGNYIDKVSIFTSNINTTPYVDLSKYDNIEISENKIRLYSNTKNIPSDTILTYKIYNSENQEVTNNVSFTNNIVAENNINTSVEFSKNLDSGNYRIDVIYNSNVISSTNIKIKKMQGSGTFNDPYVITNSIQLNQIRDDLDAHYILGNDIDLTEDTREGGKLSLESTVCPQGFGWESIIGFNGSLDGKGHTIKGLYQNNYLECNVDNTIWQNWNMYGNGLFGYAYGDVTIKNLVLEDFDISCTKTKDSRYNNCGVLLSNYNGMNYNNNDKNEYNAIFENIVLKNSNTRNAYLKRDVYGGGLFGSFESYYGNILISNIYLDFEMEAKSFSESAYLLSWIQGKNVNINNIQLKGNFDGKWSDGSGDAVLIYTKINNAGEDTVKISNVLSTVTGKNLGGILYNSGGDSNNINNINALSIEDTPLCRDNCESAKNVKLYNKDTELYKLTDKNNYSTWENFDKNWSIKTVDGIPRLPVLKFVDFEYTNIDDISIKQKLNEHKNIYDYIEPNIDSAKRISYKSNNENIVKIDENGVIIPQKTGKTTIHIESYYDGYIKDVPITIEYVPHYTIHFDNNNTKDYYKEIEGTMESIEVEVGNSFTLPANKFTQEYYEFKEWNTKSDGTGISYSDLSEIQPMGDKEEITLYVQWWGKERTVTFDANGGSVTPDKKVVRIREKYGELPIPTRSGYGFERWKMLEANPTSIYAFAPLNGLNLQASWKEDAYTIIYDANGGIVNADYIKYSSDMYLVSDVLATSYAYNNKEKEIYENVYEKEGYIFKEWNTKADGTGNSYTEKQKITLNNVENSTLRLYAIWEKEGLTLNKEKVFLSPNDTDKLIIKLVPEDSNVTYTWISSDNNIVSVDNDGNIIAKSLGKATITVTSSNGYTATCEVTVSDYMKGDINKDGNITITDVIKLLRVYLSLDEEENDTLAIGDMNEDKSITITDVIKLLRIYLGLE